MSNQETVNHKAPLLTDSFWKLTNKNKELLDKGIPTLIPFTTPGLRSIVPGIIPGEVIIITGSTGSGKSKMTRKLALKDILEYCHSKKLKLKIFLNSLEESTEKVIATLVVKELKLMFNVDSSYYDVVNYKENKSLSPQSMEKINQARLSVEKKYGDVLVVTKQSNGYAWYKMIRKYLFEVGTFYNQTFDAEGKLLTQTKSKIGDKWNYYEYHEPTLVVTITDTIDKMQGYTETRPTGKVQLSSYDAISKLVHYYFGELLSPICKVTNFIVSQQKPDKERLETNIKGHTMIEKLKPSLDTIRTNRSIQETATLILAVFNPVKFGEFNYGNYRRINEMKAYQFRSCLVLKCREGLIEYPKDEIPLACQFQLDDFEQMPLPSETEKLKKYYE